ncbi:hypothetical protein M378DRAFT_159718, partial [Amanita muscaria Koide BX008]
MLLAHQLTVQTDLDNTHCPALDNDRLGKAIEPLGHIEKREASMLTVQHQAL